MKRTHGGGQTGGGNTWMRVVFAALAVGSVFALAACGDDSSDSGGGATAAMGGGGSETVSVDSLGDAGDVLVDADGAALYTPDQEANGKILCASADCTAIWKPVTVSGGSPSSSSDIQDKLGTLKRPDGDTQVTFDGKPLYSFTEEGPGEVTGDGFEDDFDGTHFVWHVVTPSGVSSGSGSSDSSSSSGGSGYSY
jgi:predicted lipoprotein with Yx(FWY)xxD motif